MALTPEEREFKKLYGKEPTGFDLIQFHKNRGKPLNFKDVRTELQKGQAADDYPFLPKPRSDFNRTARKGHRDVLA